MLVGGFIAKAQLLFFSTTAMRGSALHVMLARLKGHDWYSENRH
jgi:hypothetical protein